MLCYVKAIQKFGLVTLWTSEPSPFKRLLKTYLFERWDCGTLWLFVWIVHLENFLLANLLTYLLNFVTQSCGCIRYY